MAKAVNRFAPASDLLKVSPSMILTSMASAPRITCSFVGTQSHFSSNTSVPIVAVGVGLLTPLRSIRRVPMSPGVNWTIPKMDWIPRPWGAGGTLGLSRHATRNTHFRNEDNTMEGARKGRRFPGD